MSDDAIAPVKGSDMGNKQASEKTQTQTSAQPADAIKERGGPKGPEPTRFGDWENNGRCTDF